MTTDQAVELARGAIAITLLLGAPVLLVSALVGLAISTLQALTQIQEQTLTFVPKVLVMLLTILFTLPWAIQQMVEYTVTLFRNIPSSL